MRLLVFLAVFAFGAYSQNNMRLTKIYTKIGDKGSTSLASGQMVPKYAPRIEAYGTVDELNSFVGLLADELGEDAKKENNEALSELINRLKNIQNELFDLGGELSTPLDILKVDRQQVVSAANVARLEAEMDQYNEDLSPLENFVLPGGHRSNSLAHVCRTVCRRAERAVVFLGHEESLRDEPRIYLNRLSDWFFVVSRVLSREFKSAERLWNQRGKKPVST